MLYLYKASLIDLFARIQHIHADPEGSHAECLAVQEAIIQKVTYVERKIRQLRRHRRELKASLRTADPAQRLTREESALVKADMTQCDVDIDEYWRLLTIFKEIGDAIAFTYIDKYNIKPMAFKQS